jgi:hypothetical protein
MSHTKTSFAALRSAFDSDDEDSPCASGGAPYPSSTLPQYEDFYARFSDIDRYEDPIYPCSCCHHMTALDSEDGYWTCKRGRRWLLLGDDEAPPSWPSNPICRPLMRWLRAEVAGISWGELVQQELDLELAAETPRERAIRLAREQEAERQAALRELAARQAWEADMVGLRAKKGLKKGDSIKKIPQPCKKLYSCEGDKKCGGAKPTTLHVSSECWAHEYTHAQTGKRVVKHECPWLHPDEEGWHAEWDTNRNFRPAAAAGGGAGGGNRFAALGGPRRPAAAAAPAGGHWEKAGPKRR